MAAENGGFGRLQRQIARLDLREHQEKIMLLLALVIGAVVGLVVVGFVALTERLSRVLLTAGPWQRVAIPLAGSLVGGWLLYRFFPDARGSGIPQTRVALVLQNGYISMRTVIGKFVCSSISLGSGVALGREGPSVHIGAGIASFASRKLGLSDTHVRSLIPVGTAAAVAAAFNTPLAAVLFTLEEILVDLHARVVGSVVIGAATSWIVLRLILGDEPLFHVPAYQLVDPVEFLIYGLLGVLGGLVSTVFVKSLLWQRAMFRLVPKRWLPFTPGAGGLVVGLLALAVPGVLGVGYNLVGEALNGQIALRMMLILLVLKLIATTACYGSGNAGGIFGPSLFIGAMLGGSVGYAAHAILPDSTGNAGAYALVGMGAAFAGIVRTPMTSVIMIFEVTRDYTIIVPLMIANMCSYVLAQRLQKLPIYEALSRQDGIDMPSPSHRPEPLTVERAMRPLEPAEEAITDSVEFLYVHPDDPIDAALQRMGESGVEEILVVSRVGGKRIGMLHSADVLQAYSRTARDEDREKSAGAAVRNWLPAVAAICVAAVLIVSGLVFWQKSRVAGRIAKEFKTGETSLAEGQVDEAILAFRSALAQAPRDVEVRKALGLALVRAGQFTEAQAYLAAVAKAQPENGPVWLGLAEIAKASGDKRKALDLYRQALAKEWPGRHDGRDDARRRSAQLDYAALLAESGRPAEAVSLLLAAIEQRGDDPETGRKAAEMVESIGPVDRAEAAYAALASRFPAESGVWMHLGDARFAEQKDTAALEAYQHAAALDPDDAGAKSAVARTGEVLRLDPAATGLSVRERARRWDEVFARVVDASKACGPAPEMDQATPLLSKKAVSFEAMDRKMELAQRMWRNAPEKCKTDLVLAHVMAKFPA